jgi:predicted transcriptional regulator
MTIRDTLAFVTAISVRLDDEALRALTQLEAAGLSRSDAIRRAIIDSAIRLQRGKALASEVAALEADEVDRREMLEVAAMMESMRASRRRV